ncbi:EAL domain-containing protein [Paraglaciecola aquimarina]|uniref:EAL domain-containing protein n=1 Tax=Paraglaciecola aquimarina TaxID=1235557 RepID=A0ABU3SVW4_9ALTE|nr:EAL domain-containing protein [Paraglaciecola aquimarina]MDU0354139.1 EAL domain-containing protein [Paraglaciecola aquimarina]
MCYYLPALNLPLEQYFIPHTSNQSAKCAQRDALDLLYGNNSGSLVVTLSICLALVFGFPDNPVQSLKVYWLLFMCAIFVWRFLQTRHWKTKLKGQVYDATKPMSKFKIGRYLTACGFSAYSIMFFHAMDVIELACTIVILSAMAGGAATTLAASKVLCRSYAAILLIPISLLSIVSEDSYHNTLGILGGIFVVIMYSAAKRAHQFTTESILIKNQHADLLEEMELKNQQISEANTTLERKVKKRTDEIFELSNIDPLTKLFNRNAFSENLRLLIDSCKLRDTKLAVLFIDLDGFKSINDSLGHTVGDKVLLKTAQRLTNHSEKAQSLCRWGGDEFLIALENVEGDDALQFARQLISNLSKPIIIEQHELNVGATVGIAMYPDHGTDEIELITLADTAMYQQKQSVKSEVCMFTEQMRETLYRQITLKNGLSSALKNNQLYMVYQPVVDCDTGQVGFCEALLRWELDGKLIPPSEFIPVAEQYGLIYSIGAWVMQQSCQQAASWSFDKDVSVSVNVSVAQLMHGDLVNIVTRALHDSGLPAENLHIEITESIFAADINYVLQQMKSLQKLNIKVSVDDFGTGFSSLALLQSLSADVVKIDRSFISTIDKGGKAIIQATQYMANELGYSVVAEGVETKKQADDLKAMGVANLQGFYFGKPMKLEKLDAWHQGFKQDNRKL